ncbi:hypothetical protein [Sphingomonas sp.]|uniref:hypothetical protein n=1 Tax=Sphingomonas sp. TaxID=28214 RepID=UPI00286A7003|nr:hypothetical protein [Sphingomonas sp.]
MRPIIVVMLLVDLGIVLATAFGVAMRKPTPERLRPIWISFAVSLLIGGLTSLNIASDHDGQPGADILAFVGPMMIGMAIMGALIALRERHGSGAAPTA